MKRLLTSTLTLLWIVTMVLFSGCTAKPLCYEVTVPAVQKNVTSDKSYILAMIDDEFCKLNGCEAFATEWCFDEWTLTDTEPSGQEPTVSIRFSELYIVELFASGQAAVYDGYTVRDEQSYAFYTIPSSVAANVKAFLEANAEPCELGDANRSTFVHHNIHSIW